MYIECICSWCGHVPHGWWSSLVTQEEQCSIFTAAELEDLAHVLGQSFGSARPQDLQFQDKAGGDTEVFAAPGALRCCCL